jgi:fructokinase
MPKTILAFGEVLWDLLPTGPQLGGAPFNFVYRADGLGDAGVMVSRLGRDDLGRHAMERIIALGIDPARIQWDDDHPTGTVKVSFDEQKRPDFVIIPGVAYEHIETTDALLAAAAAADCICFGTLIQRAPTSAATLGRVLAAAAGAVKLLDINLRKDCYTRETIVRSLGAADVLKLSDEEAAALADMLSLEAGGVDAVAVQLVRRYALACCVVTLGERGALAASGDGQVAYVPGYEVEPADSLGSGDAFAAGFIHKYLRREPPAECCRFGNALGAIVATQEGATAPVDAGELARFPPAGTRRIEDGDLATRLPGGPSRSTD